MRAAVTTPPALPEIYMAEMTKVREQITAVRSAVNVEQAVKLTVPAQETASKLTERLIMSVTAVENRMAALEITTAQAMSTMAQTTPIERKRKSLAESKCVGNMKTLGSDKAEFRMWNEKFINAIAQV